MAKSCRSEKFSKCTIDREDGTITEYLKDTTNVYKIDDLLTRWNGIENVSISISTDDEIPSVE